MRIAKLLGGAGLLVTAAIVGGTLIGSALAAPSSTSGTGSSADPQGPAIAGEYCDVYLDTLASELGVSRDALLPASQAAAIAAIDAAVADGNLDQDRAATMKERINAITDAGCAFVAGLGHAFAKGEARGFMHADVLDAAAGALNLDSSDLIDQMADGTSLEEIAGTQNVDYDTVKTAVVTAVKADLDAAVAEGLDQDRADAMLERIETWLDDGGDGAPRGMGPGMRGHGAGPGGPWH